MLGALRQALSRSWLRHLKPLNLDFYILEEVFFPFLGGIFFFCFVFLMFQALRLAEFFIIHGVSGWILLKMIFLLILTFLPTLLPIAFLIGILVGFGRLSGDSEIVALKANGISLWRMTFPVILLASVVVVLSLGLNLTWAPWGDRTFKSTLIRVSNTKVVSSIKEGTFTSGFYDLLIFADKLDPKTNRLHRVFIFDEREPKNPTAVVAREGEIVPVKAASDLGAAAMLKLYNGNIHSSNSAETTYQKINFGEYRLFLKIDEGADTATLKPSMIPYEELISKLNELDPTTSKFRELKTEYWRRFAVAMSPMIFVFLGIGFGTVRTRAVRAGAALIALIVISVYWTVQVAATVAAQKGAIPPFVAMQIANFIMITLAIFGYRSAAW